MNILITGAPSGIGFNTGVILAKYNHHVYLTAKNDIEVNSLNRKIKELRLKNIECFKLDINDESDRNKIVDMSVDTLINNAAIGIGGSLIDLSISDIRKNFETNVFSTLDLTKKFIDSKDRGNIVTISSLAGIIPIPFLGIYSSTKSALISIFSSLHKEMMLNKKDIRIKLVEPGLYKTGFNQVMLDINKDIINKEKYNNVDSMISFLDSAVNFLELNRTTSIAKKVAQAATSKTNRLKYRAPLIQVIGAKIYMLLFK